jgi:hypothetical protein
VCSYAIMPSWFDRLIGTIGVGAGDCFDFSNILSENKAKIQNAIYNTDQRTIDDAILNSKGIYKKWEDPNHPKFGQNIDHLRDLTSQYRSILNAKSDLNAKWKLNSSLPVDKKAPQSQIQQIIDLIQTADSEILRINNAFPDIYKYL